MESIQDYMARMNFSLSDDYKTPDKRFRENCFLIAREVQSRLLRERKDSRLFWVRNTQIDSNGNRQTLTPKKYEGRVNTWRVHVVAVAENQVFDPMIGKPVSIDDYCGLAFEGETEILPQTSANL